jgi:hypothetical protein
LLEALNSELSLLWKRYALGDASRLTPAARNLKERMLAAFKNSADAAKAT